MKNKNMWMGIVARAGVIALSLVLMGLIMNLCSPGAAGPFAILTVLALAYVVFYVLFEAIVLLIISILDMSKLRYDGGRSGIVKIVAPLAIAPVIIVGLNTLSSLGVAELVLVLIFVLLLCVYNYKTSRK